MAILFTLFLLFQSGSIESELDQQIHTYFLNIENDVAVSESLWSLMQIYLENENYREKLFNTGEELDIGWIELLDRNEANHAGIHDIALLFRDEHLHLYLQLQEFPAEERLIRFEEFYNQVEKSELKEVIRVVAEGADLNPGYLDQSEWDFSVFLLLSYSGEILVDDTEFYPAISQSLNEMLESGSGNTSDFMLASLFLSLYHQEDFHSIFRRYDVFHNLPALPNTFIKRNLYWSLDFSLYRVGYVDRSLEIQRRHTIPLTQLMDDYETLNHILASHGGYLYSLGKFSEARDVFSAALADTSNLSASVQIRLLNNLSLVYYKLGENDLYVETQIQALEFATEQEDVSSRLNIYRNLHIYYRENRNWNLALRYIDEARQLAETTDNQNELASIIISNSVYHKTYLNDSVRAYELLSEASALLEGTTNYRLQVRTLYEQANIYREAGNLERTRETFNEVLTIGADNNQNRMYLEAIIDLADTELRMGNPEASRRHILEFNAHDITVVDFYVLVNARRIEAEIAVREGRLHDADRLIKQVYDQVLDRARNTTDIEAGYWHIEQAYLELFKLYADLLDSQQRYGEMVQVLDQLKTINDASLTENPLVKAERLTEEELTESRRITQELDQLRKNLLVAPESEKLALQGQISSLSARRGQLTHQSPDARFSQGLEIWAIQSRLRSGELILHTTRVLDQLYLVFIDRNDILHRKVAMGDAEDSMFESAIRGLTNGNTNLNELHDIFTYLGLDAISDRVRSLIVVPDSYLYQLPLDVLPVTPPAGPTSYGSSEFLIEKMEVRYLNNLHEFTRNSPKGLYDLDFAGIGISDFQQYGSGQQLISLPQAPSEVTGIIESMDRIQRSEAILESEATPQAFRTHASTARILHLASHSTISESDPLFSTIYLHRDDELEETGQIFAYQLFDMNLNNELIMLNSCDSGSGEYFQGAGIMGLSRALRYAGAQSLILNSWAVNDQFASDFAIELYTHLNSGKSKSLSLREAKISFLKNNNANPHYWGPYMLNGSSRPIVDEPGGNLLTGVLLFLFIAGIFYSQQRMNGNRVLPDHSQM